MPILRLFITIMLLTPGYLLHAASAYSPYIEAHKSDAVNWYDLTREVVSLAEEQQKLLLVSSGYASCYWCHRMKIDTFNDQKTAELINAHFIPILIDRDLDPDTDAKLQEYMQQTRGFGGWPVTVVFTPNGRPLAGFSYIQPDRLIPRLHEIVKVGETRSKSPSQNNKQIVATPAGTADNSLAARDLKALLDNFLLQVQSAADEQFGGFGDAEKFPYVSQLSALLEVNRRATNEASIRFIQTTLTAMLGSSFKDHVGGGFFRYTSDRRWTYPHYEKMLYTQALVGPLLIKAGEYLQQPVFLQAGIETLEQMNLQFRREDGLYNTALSAFGNDGESGSYYLWEKSEIQDVLGSASENVLFNLLGDDSEKILPFFLTRNKNVRQQLLERRQQRQISIDDKVLTGQNGLVLSALNAAAPYSASLARAARILSQQVIELTDNGKYRKSLLDRAAPAADIADMVYMAKGLCDTAASDMHTDSRDLQSNALQHCKMLLSEAANRFLGQEGWRNRNNHPLLDLQETRSLWLLPDSQLPSPSTLWLQTIWGLEAQQLISKHSNLANMAVAVIKQFDKSISKEAFFHASLLETILNHPAKLDQLVKPSTLMESQ